MKVLVTGGMGFIGSNFIRRLHELHPDYQIINFDAITYAGNPENLSTLVSGDSSWYTFVKGDIANGSAVKDIFTRSKPDVVVNFAAESHVDRSLVDAEDFIKTNIVGTEVLLKAVRQNKIPHFIHISTDEIYGDVSKNLSDENSPLRPSNPYAASKAAADLIVQSYVKCYDIPATIVRGSNNFGAYQYPEKIIPLVITNILGGEKIPLHGSGDHMRTWIHVLDFSDAILKLLHEDARGDIYNIAGNSIMKNNELIKIICSKMGVNFKDVVEHVNDRPGADFRYAPDGRKFNTKFNWKPERDIPSSLLSIIDWYKENSYWWQSLKAKKEFADHYEKQRRGKYY